MMSFYTMRTTGDSQMQVQVPHCTNHYRCQVTVIKLNSSFTIQYANSRFLIHLWSKHDKRNQWFGNSLPWHNKSPTNSQSKKYHNRNKASFISYFYYIGSLQDSQALTERKGDKQQDAFGNWTATEGNWQRKKCANGSNNSKGISRRKVTDEYGE